MLVRITEESVEIVLSPWQKALGLLGNIKVARAEVGEVQVIEKPIGGAMRSGMMAGLRIPGVYYVARTIRLDEAWIVRRGVPALSFSVHNQGALKRVVVSTPEAEVLAQRLRTA